MKETTIKVITKVYYEHGIDKIEYDTYLCEKCGYSNYFSREQFNYCPSCGRKINWYSYDKIMKERKVKKEKLPKGEDFIF